MNDESHVMYNGREMSKQGFRVFVYAKNGRQKLVNSWDEFKSHIEHGEWFSSIEEIMAQEQLDMEESLVESESKKRGRKKASE